MGQEPSGLVEGARKVYDRVTGAIKRIPTPGYTPRSEDKPRATDTRVDDAMESFRRSATKTTPKRSQKKMSKRK